MITRPVGAVLLALFLLTRCAGPDGLATVTGQRAHDDYPSAQLLGELSAGVVGDTVCFVVLDAVTGGRWGLVLPYGWSGTADGRGMVDPDGAVVAETGGRYLFGGGQYALEPVWGDCPPVDDLWLTSPVIETAPEG